jgi:hypothetical protein
MTDTGLFRSTIDLFKLLLWKLLGLEMFWSPELKAPNYIIESNRILQIVYFVCIWLAMAFLEFGWQLFGINPFPDTISIPFADIHNYSYPKLAAEMIPDWLIWTILICTGPVIHIFLLGFARSYRLDTGFLPIVACV